MIRNCTLDEFYELTKDQRIVCFGAGKNCRHIIETNMLTILYIIESNRKKVGEKIDNHYIIGWNDIDKILDKIDVILITPNDFEEIYKRICSLDCLKNKVVYVYALMKRLQADRDREPLVDQKVIYQQKDTQMIPKKIHYFWFSDDPYPDEVKRCIESWKKYCPDYEIIKWDMDNYDYNKNQYAREAIEHRKWAFASDVGRADVIWRFGGVYLDADVELVRNIDDLLYHNAFIGFQDRSFVDPGSGFGAVPGNEIVGEFLNCYEDMPFVLDNGTLNMVSCPNYITSILIKHGLVRDGSFQMVDDVAVYPYDYFCPHSYKTGLIAHSNNTYSIHHHHGAWLDSESKRLGQMAYRFIDMYNKNTFK